MSTLLASLAGRVQQRFSGEAEDELVDAFDAWQDGSARDRRELGDPATIVLETDLVVRLVVIMSMRAGRALTRAGVVG